MCDVVLVVAAHADDEVLGCGGTIAKHLDNGDKVTVMFMTDGVSARDNVSNVNTEERSTAASRAMSILGVKDIRQSNFPDNEMDTVPLLNIVKDIELVVQDINPRIVYTHFANDLNVDHQITLQAVMTACRPQKWNPVKEIYTFEVLSSTEWSSKSNNAFIGQKINDVSCQWQRKLDALNAYSEEMREFPHSRSIECVDGLGCLRGATHGIVRAEAFFVERIVS